MPLSRRALLAATLAPIPARAAGGLAVVASFSVLADLVRAVGGGRAAVSALVGPDADIHAFQPRPSDIARIAAADLFVVNGLGLEGWAGRLAGAARLRRPPLVVSRGLIPLMTAGGPDPHAWQDVANARHYARVIRDGLIAADPAGAAAYAEAAAAYDARLAALDGDIRSALAAIPRARRRIVTTHDALAYYGAAYGLDLLAPLGIDAEAEPSARAIAGLVRQIRREGVRALFLENMTNAALLTQVARETGIRIGATLYTDALSPPAGPAPTYEAMMRHNTAAIVAALR